MLNLKFRYFKKAFGELPAIVAYAPGRVELLGNHTDYNQGHVLSFAIDYGLWVAVGRHRNQKLFRFYSERLDDKVIIDSVQSQSEHVWVNYPLGIVDALMRRSLRIPPFSLAVHGNLSVGAGLSSSASLEIATALAINELYELSIAPETLAHICQKAENQFLGMRCGLLDQYTVLFGKAGHALHIDFKNVEFRTIPLSNLDLCIAIVDSRISHALVTTAYNDRHAECKKVAAFFRQVKGTTVNSLRDITSTMLDEAQGRLDPVYLKRARHIVGENARVLKGIEYLEKGAYEEFGQLLYQSHESSRRFFENSCAELDLLVSIASEIDGVYGSRLTGGGFGGATLTLLKRSAIDRFKATVIRKYSEKTGRIPVILFTRAAEGARVVS